MTCCIFHLTLIFPEIILNWQETNPWKRLISSLPGLTVLLKYTLDFKLSRLITIMLIKQHLAWLKPKILICNTCYLHGNISQENMRLECNATVMLRL